MVGADRREICALLLRPAAIERQHVSAVRRQRRGQPVAGDDHGRRSVGQHEGQPFLRVGRIERQIAAPSLEHGEQGRHALPASLQADADAVVRPHAQPPQPARQQVRQPVEVFVGQRSAVGGQDGGRLRGPLRLFLDEAMDTGRAVPGVDIVPFREDLLALGRRQQGQLRQAPLRIGRRPFQQGAETLQDPVRGRRVEQVRGVFETGEQPAVRLDQEQGEVELRRPPSELQGRQGETRHGEVAKGHVQQGEQHLEERRMGEGPLRRQVLDQPFERQVLVREGQERLLADPQGQLPEARVRGKPGAQGQGVGEEADQAFDLRPRAVGDRSADDQVGLSGQPEEQGVPGGEQDHEEGEPLAAAECCESCGEAAGDTGGPQPAPAGGDRRPRAVRGKLQHGRRAGQPLPPEGELRFQGLALHPAPLPDREVGVLHRQGRQRRGTPLAGGRIEGRQLADQHAARPGVGDDVVHRDQGDVLRGAETQQSAAQEGPMHQVERA